jgi:hypothetical protein
MERFRKTDEELRRKLGEKEDETGQLMYVNMANERKIADLSTKVGDVSLFIFLCLFLFLLECVFSWSIIPVSFVKKGFAFSFPSQSTFIIIAYIAHHLILFFLFFKKASLGMASQIAVSSNTRQRDEECDRLRAEVSRLTGVLESKSNEVSVAMVTFAEMQRMTVEREGELKAKLHNAETK